MKTKYSIGQTIEDTIGYGTVKVMDIFISTIAPDKYYCYRVESDTGSFLCSEEELQTEKEES